MLVSNGTLVHVFDEVVRDGVPRLGRHLALDARSLAYTIEREMSDLGRMVAIRPAEHLPAIDILDQGRLGSCTGNAGSYALSALVGPAGLATARLDGKVLSRTNPAANEDFAALLYHEATVNDGFPGTWPPSDTGSSGLGVCRALKEAGLVSKYTWALSATGFAALLQRGTVLMGLPWYNAFFHPDSHGFIDADPNWQASGIAGGHEVCCVALESWDAMDPRRSVVTFPNSWATSWGDRGYGRFRMSTYEALKQQIDLKQLAA